MTIMTEVQLNVTNLIYPHTTDLSNKLTDNNFDIQIIKELVDKYIKIQKLGNSSQIGVSITQNNLGINSIWLSTCDYNGYELLEIAKAISKELYPELTYSNTSLVEEDINIRQLTIFLEE